MCRGSPHMRHRRPYIFYIFIKMPGDFLVSLFGSAGAHTLHSGRDGQGAGHLHAANICCFYGENIYCHSLRYAACAKMLLHTFGCCENWRTKQIPKATFSRITFKFYLNDLSFVSCFLLAQSKHLLQLKVKCQSKRDKRRNTRENLWMRQFVAMTVQCLLLGNWFAKVNRVM